MNNDKTPTTKVSQFKIYILSTYNATIPPLPEVDQMFIGPTALIAIQDDIAIA